jgi:hypothetical protein
MEWIPALDGERMWIGYGDPRVPRRIRIDAGRAGTRKDLLLRLLEGVRARNQAPGGR